jgi:predicted 2-oxoglutarate/Fe(II)-dependent dioxygenase YbiX
MKPPEPDPAYRMRRRLPVPAASHIVLDGFIDVRGCRQLRAAMDAGIAETAEVLADGVAADTTARLACVVEIDPPARVAVERRIDMVRAELSARSGLPLGRREGSGFVRYFEGGYYRRHRDRATDGGWPGAARRRLAVVVFLNGDFTGGELVLHAESGDDPVRITPRTGMLVAFDAGQSHEVRTVTSGIRDVIVDWFY